MEGNHWARENQSLGEAGVLVTGPPKWFSKKNIASMSPLAFLLYFLFPSLPFSMYVCDPIIFIGLFIYSALLGVLTGSEHPPPRVEKAQVNKTKASFGPRPHKAQSNAGYRQLNSNCNARGSWEPVGWASIRARPRVSTRRSWSKPHGTKWEWVSGMCRGLGGQGAPSPRGGVLIYPQAHACEVWGGFSIGCAAIRLMF